MPIPIETREQRANELRAVLAAIAEGYDYRLHDHSDQNIGYFIVVQDPKADEEWGVGPNLVAQVELIGIAKCQKPQKD